MYTYVDDYTSSSFNVVAIQFDIPQLCLIKIFHHTNPTSFKCKLI